MKRQPEIPKQDYRFMSRGYSISADEIFHLSRGQQNQLINFCKLVENQLDNQQAIDDMLISVERLINEHRAFSEITTHGRVTYLKDVLLSMKFGVCTLKSAVEDMAKILQNYENESDDLANKLDKLYDFSEFDLKHYLFTTMKDFDVDISILDKLQSRLNKLGWILHKTRTNINSLPAYKNAAGKVKKKGRDPKSALTILIEGLCGIFIRFHKETEYDPAEKSELRRLTKREIRENYIRFVDTALKAADIPEALDGDISGSVIPESSGSRYVQRISKAYKNVLARLKKD